MVAMLFCFAGLKSGHDGCCECSKCQPFESNRQQVQQRRISFVYINNTFESSISAWNILLIQYVGGNARQYYDHRHQ